jgi:6-phosphofructokinase 1
MPLPSPSFASPLPGPFVEEDERTLVSPLVRGPSVELSFERAGPRARLAFDPARTKAAIVTCGGLCPGINNVVRALSLQLLLSYGVREVVGFRYGFEGMTRGGLEPVVLSRDVVRHIHRLGGSVLGTSRGRQDTAELVNTLAASSVDVLFTVGGNGTLRAARDISEEIDSRGLPIAVVAIPKTIDDDIALIDKSFGFETAIEHARAAIDAAHVEAIGARNGVGVVKLMGRDAGFIAAHATLASAEANFCLLPEYPFAIRGPHGLLAALRRRLEQHGHAVIVAAEGCGLRLADGDAERDASGNLRYASPSLDFGPFLCDAIKRDFEAANVPITLKYIDPSYTIRAAPANAADAIYCAELARFAGHAAMAGKTNVLVGRCHGVYAHVPIPVVAGRLARVERELWLAVTEVTGQPTLE